jgi:transglutaminase-like putative cysteine protease
VCKCENFDPPFPYVIFTFSHWRIKKLFMPQYHIQHITRYTYSSPVTDCMNQLILYPLQDSLQEVKQHRLRITNDPPVSTYTDYFGNTVGVFSILPPHTELQIVSEMEVITHAPPEPVLTSSIAAQWQQLAQLHTTVPYLEMVKAEAFKSKAELLSVLQTLMTTQDALPEVVRKLSEYIYNGFTYRKGVTSVETGIDEIWALRAGVCQDFAHLLLVMLRLCGIPARYVSGYICPRNQELRGEGATHAWVEAYLPGYGWLGVDPTNNCLVSDRHVRLAVGRNFSDCTPVKGTYKGSAAHTLEVSVVIGNGDAKEIVTGEPAFQYTVQQEPEAVTNSYRRFAEMQMQQ